jgi:hypothetical protein
MDLPLINSILREISSPVAIPHLSIPSVKISYIIGFVVVMLFGKSVVNLLLRLPEVLVDSLDSLFRTFYVAIDTVIASVTPSFAFRTTAHSSSSSSDYFSEKHEKSHATWGDTFDYHQQSTQRGHANTPHRPSTSCNVECYDVLGLSPSATPKEAKNAYRSLIKKTHPDLFVRASPERQRRASVTSVKLREAYEAIIAAHGPEL